MSAADTIELPEWARVGAGRREHIARVVALLHDWSAALNVMPEEARAWRDAGLWHDALRDAPTELLRELAPMPELRPEMLHGPAAAALLERGGEPRADVLSAVRWHTVGCRSWSTAGRALFMADYLEPGRRFARGERSFLAAQVPRDFDGVFKQVVRLRIEWAVRDGHQLLPWTVDLWNSLR